jgi:hypothetical protein
VYVGNQVGTVSAVTTNAQGISSDLVYDHIGP